MAKFIPIFGYLSVLMRAAILCFQSLAVGGILFLVFVTRREELRPQEFLHSAWKLIRWSTLGLAFSQICSAAAASIVLAYTADLPFKTVLGANFVLAALLAVLASFAIALWPAPSDKKLNPLILLPAGMMLAAAVMTSHSASRMEGRAFLSSLTTLHYLTTACWIGGLPYLLLSMKRISDSAVRMKVVRNFSRLALVSVFLLAFSGLGMSWTYVASWAAVYGTAYGAMVSTKVILFFFLLCLGAANYFILRRVDSDARGGTTSLMRFAEVEIGIGLSIILTAASLTSLPPAADLTQDRVTPQEIAARYAPRIPRYSSPDLKQLAAFASLSPNGAATSGSPAPVFSDGGQLPVVTNNLWDKAWSEYNHNWAGFIVFVMGILALLSRSRHFEWAKAWPLVFLGLAIFLFLRSDPENWPLGPTGFWASFVDPEVLQHRAVVVLVTLFAIFTWRVETGRMKSMAAALVFPGVCVVGGMVLLTHSHAVGNVKEELLIELSHTSLAILGIAAGWSRWLELRLPAENKASKYLAWVWPVCFILVGLVLMDYHEM